MEGEDQSAEQIHSQPQAARKESSGNIATHSDLGDSNGRNNDAYTSNTQQIPTLKHFSLPPLPPEDSSLMYARSDDDANSSDGQIDQGLMERHLMDVESSFMPVLSPINHQAGEDPGVDDTFLFDGARSSRVADNDHDDTALNKQSTDADVSTDPLDSPATPPSAYKTPGPRHQDSSNSNNEQGEADYGITTSSLETMSSSPTAAAVARTISRTMSRLSNGQNPSTTGSDTVPSESSIAYEDSEVTPKKAEDFDIPQDDFSDGQSTVLRNPSPSREENDHYARDAGNTPGAGLLQRKLSGRRSRFLRSRHTSQQSSVSSFLSNPEEDSTELTAGTDFAFHSGSALSGSHRSRPSSMTLSRSISLGSMASALDEANSSGEAAGMPLATLEEEGRNKERESSVDDGNNTSPPETPRASNRPPSIVPTDTVIAQHVKNVHVPEAIAKEFRFQNGVSSPGKRTSFAAPANGRGRNLTLKEQSHTIERLSKENFDLKLKVMFLSDRLDKLSEEGVKEMISENVELRTGLAIKQRENLALKRKNRELEQKLKNEGERPQTGRSGASEDDRSQKWFDQEGAQEKEEELTYLREKIEEYVTEVEKLRNESMTREAEKRKLAEVVRSMGQRRGSSLESKEEMDVWKDLLEQETARREQADLDNQKLRDDLFRLRSEATTPGGIPGLTHTTNIYNITKKRQVSPSRPRSGLSERVDDRNGTFSTATTLVDELRAETEHLRHENAELRREVGAQTSMLTSRNKERERLTAELEEIKLGQRRGGGSMAGDSILDRSASRANERPASRDSGITRETGLTDQEREDFENENAELRDKHNALKMEMQDLQRQLEASIQDYEIAMEGKKDAEDDVREMQGEAESLYDDLQNMRNELDHTSASYAQLQEDAQADIDELEAMLRDFEQEKERLQAELSDKTEDFNALQAEVRSMSEAMVRAEDDMDSKNRRIQELMQDAEEYNRDVEEMEKNLTEANDKINRLTVQQESAQSEISFLREEQDGDKIKIGDLGAALKDAEASIQDEKERVREMEERIASERHQRELIGSREKQEVQKIINELNREITSTKDESRQLRKSLGAREVECAEWKERLNELENNLREALGDMSGTRSSFLKSIASLQRQLDNYIRELDSTKAELLEKERLIKHRDALLESHGLESRKISEILEKERQAHRSTKHSFESFQKTHQHITRTVSQQETRINELETGRAQDRKKIASLENNSKDQLLERNNLLLALWGRLSAICGKDWAHDNSLINGRALPTVETISTMLPGFSKNLWAAVKTIEALVGDFKTSIRRIEKDFDKTYLSLTEEFEAKCKKIERMETLVRSGMASSNFDAKAAAEISKFKEVNRMLKAENAELRTFKHSRTNIDAFGADIQAPSPSPSVPTGPGSQTKNIPYDSHIPRPASMSRRHASASAASTGALTTEEQRTASSSSNKTLGTLTNSSGQADDLNKNDVTWIYRMREYEKKMKEEREGRKRDRSAAKARLEQQERENNVLKDELERMKLLVRMEGEEGEKDAAGVLRRRTGRLEKLEG